MPTDGGHRTRTVRDGRGLPAGGNGTELRCIYGYGDAGPGDGAGSPGSGRRGGWGVEWSDDGQSGKPLPGTRSGIPQTARLTRVKQSGQRRF